MVVLIAALLFIFFIPGFLLVNAIFPRKGELDREYDTIYRITLGIVLSIIIVIISGFILDYLSTGTEGYVTSSYIWTILIALSVFFFLVGWLRGAYPFMGKIHPALMRLPSPEPQSIMIYSKKEKNMILKFKALAEKRDKLRSLLKDYERREGLHSGKMRVYYQEKRKKAMEELKAVDTELAKMEEERSMELY